MKETSVKPHWLLSKNKSESSLFNFSIGCGRLDLECTSNECHNVARSVGHIDYIILFHSQMYHPLVAVHVSKRGGL